jgi:signal transduction histidine kinase
VVGGRRIRRKLWGVLVLPLVVTTSMAALWSVVLARDYQASAQATDVAQAALITDEMILAVQRERALTLAVLRGEAQFAPLLTTERLQVDALRMRFGDMVERTTDTDAKWPGLRSAVDQLAQIERLRSPNRSSDESDEADEDAIIEGYAEVVRSVRAATGGLAYVSVDDRQLVRGLDRIRTLGAAAEATVVEAGQLAGTGKDGFTSQEYAKFAELRAARLAAFDEFERHATADERARLAATLDSSAGREMARFEQRALNSAKEPTLGISPKQWWSAATSLADDLQSVQEDAVRSVQTRSKALHEENRRRLIALGGFVLLATATGLGAVMRAASSLSRPLATLADEADEVARVRLPAAAAQLQTVARNGVPPEQREAPELPSVATAIPPGGGEEIGRVANAIDNLQRTALSLATEQALLRRRVAESLANLGRRNQNLVRRQLRLISDLERDESDPNVLANLFELDHLATRMRRNAESLLVLTDEESPRRWAGPMPVADVIRSAIGEVEDYRRVVLRRTDEILIVGTVAAGLAHLLAELIENALAFSPPDQDVEIHARADGTSCLIAVVDHGMGMSHDELAVANDRLAGAERPMVAPTRFLGHHVVGRLAERLGVRVHLHESPLTGTTAKVTLPAELIARPAAINGAPAPRELVDAGVGAGASVPPGPPGRGVREIVRGSDESREPAEATPVPPAPPAELSARAQRLLRRMHQPGAATTAPAPTPATGSLRQAAETTRNGLVKRVPRRRDEDVRQRAPRPPAHATEPTPATDSAPPAPTPEEVGGKLASLRAAVRRAEAAEEQPAPVPSAAEAPSAVADSAASSGPAAQAWLRPAVAAPAGESDRDDSDKDDSDKDDSDKDDDRDDSAKDDSDRDKKGASESSNDSSEEGVT